MLVGPNAPIVAEPGLRGTYMEHAYDFYKPDLTSEYPYVDGHYSITCYIKALDAAYRDYSRREALQSAKTANGHAKNGTTEGAAAKMPLDRFDYMTFHAPNANWSLSRMPDYCTTITWPMPRTRPFPRCPPRCAICRTRSRSPTRWWRRRSWTLNKKRFQERVSKGTEVATMCGNMYCASVWGGLAGLISLTSSDTLQGKRIGVFSYGLVWPLASALSVSTVAPRRSHTCLIFPPG